MAEIAKHIERAEKYLQKGRQDAALHEYLEVLRENPTHEIASKVADLALTLGHRAEAVALMRQVLERQLTIGSELAVATYRKLVKVSPVLPDHSEQVGRLLEKTNSKEAIDAYWLAVRGYMEAGRKTNALTAMEAIVTLAPTVEHLCRLAELAADLKNVKKAVSVLLRAAGLEMLQDTAGAIALYARAWQLDPSNSVAALSYAQALMANETAENAAKAASALEPHAKAADSSPETRATFGRALVAAGRITEARPFFGDILQQDPRQIENLLALVSRLLDLNQIPAAVDLARRLEELQQGAGRVRDYAALMHDLAEKYSSCILFQEYLVELFNSSNREHDYCQALLRLFELYYQCGNFVRAGECLDRAAEVDPYEAGHKRRFDMLRGKIDRSRLALISGRLNTAAGTEVPDERRPEPAGGPLAQEQESNALEDLILQAEIFMQYSLRSRAIERLERIRQAFPGEEAKNEKLRALYAEAGISPTAPPPAPAAPVASPAEKHLPEESSVNDIARLTEIARSISRQGTAKSVLFTAVNAAGRHWNASRCIAVMCTPGKPPSLALEYCAPGIKSADVNATVTLVGLLYPLVIRHGPIMVPGGANGVGTESLRRSAASLCGIRSLLAMPLMEGTEHIGLLLLGECGTERRWSATDTVVLKTIADQIVLAVSNARLRRLVKSLAVTDEKSGLVKRSSYLDVLLSDARRAAQQKSALTVGLLHFGASPDMQKWEGGLEGMMQQAGQLVCSHIRQNDVAVRYDISTLAVVLADTSERNALFAIEQLRRALITAGVPPFTAGIAEAALQPGFDPADVVTEVINRVETALQTAFKEGVPERALPSPLAAAPATA